ncbi:group III truncated hemoglobin [Chitinophagaceae bacterium LWZ2-11]
MMDIESRKDIEDLMTAFYVKAFKDDVIGFYFTEVSKLDLGKHLPVIADFWESILLGGVNYKGNPMDAHKYLNESVPFKAEHFDRWAKLFCETVDELFSGDIAEMAKQRGLSISTVMKIKFVHGK